jgi:hypothetical protein
LTDVLGSVLGTGITGAIVVLGERSGGGLGAGLAGAFLVALVVVIAGLALTTRIGPTTDRSHQTLRRAGA